MECKVDNCNNPVRSRGWCRSHYERWRRYGDPLVNGYVIGANKRKEALAARTARGEKTCNTCGETKQLRDFYCISAEKNWYQGHCKECHKDKMGAIRLQNRLDNPKQPRKPVDHGACAFEGCENKATLRFNKAGDWLCSGHWQQLWVGRELSPLRIRQDSHIDDRFRRCTSCQKVKTQESFHMRTGGTTRQSECKECAYLRVRFNKVLREGGIEEATDLFNKMPEKMQDKVRPRLEAA